jgi:phage baseplate assembly protein W
MDWSGAMSKAIAYPYTLDGFGVVKPTTDVNKIYLDRVLTLLSTNVGQRPILTEYGTDIEAALFENENNFESAINQAIRQAMARWIPDVQVADIKVGVPDQDGIAQVNVTLVMPDSTLTSLTVSTSNFGADGTITR